MDQSDTAKALPVGTLTFLLTDVEGSTLLWEASREAAAEAIDRQFELIRATVAAHSGVLPEEQGEGDSVVAAFVSSADAVAAALDAQQALYAEVWPCDTPVRVRMGLHTGEADLRNGRYRGIALHRCARVRDVAHGGQTLLSE